MKPEFKKDHRRRFQEARNYISDFYEYLESASNVNDREVEQYLAELENHTLKAVLTIDNLLGKVR